MWILAALVAGVGALQYVMTSAEEHSSLQRDRKKRQEIAEEEPHLDLTGARAFWHAQVGLVGNYHIKGMPKDAVFIAQLRELTEDQFLVLTDPDDVEVARVLLWDVDNYSEFSPPEKEVTN